jgi:hypothetical protein
MDARPGITLAPLGVALALLGLACGGSRYRAPSVREVATAQTLGPRDAQLVAGDPVWIVVPYEYDGACASPEVNVELTAHEDTTEIALTGVSGCTITERSLASTVVRVGELASGRAIVHGAGVERSFDVLPAATDPGPLETSWQVRIAVARAHPPSTCFGMPSPDAPHARSVREDDPALHRRLLAAFPDEDPDVLVDLAARIDVVERARDRWEYGYTDGRCCTITEMGGEVSRRGGEWQVSEPHVHAQRNVDC